MMTLPEQLGQILIVGIDGGPGGNGWNREIENFLGTVRPGGVIFFQRNIKTAPEFRQLVESVRDFLETPPFLALDLEGGQVDRLRDVLAPLPSVRDVAKARMGKALGRIAGRELASLALNVDFAPVLDLGAPESRKILGSRTAGRSPTAVVRFAQSFLEGLSEFGISGCGKHFPGLGSAQKDSHHELPTVDKEEWELWQRDLRPFFALAAKLPMIMVAHVYCPGLESGPSPIGEAAAQPLPATLSRRIVSGLLKERMKFPGLVLADDLEMGGILEGRTMDEAAVSALKAGCDMLLLCGPTANTRRTFDALLREAAVDPYFHGIVERAAEKVLIAKKRLGIIGQPPLQTPDEFDSLRQKIKEFSDAVQRQLQRTGASEGSKEES